MIQLLLYYNYEFVKEKSTEFNSFRSQQHSQHLNQSLKDHRDSEGRDRKQTVKIQNYQPSFLPTLILPGPNLFDDDSVADRLTM
jgi:hypothetical protein